MKKKEKSGFSLIELLVVITILGILAAIVVPSVAGFLGTSEKVKLQAIFRTWVTQLNQYKSNYGYFPPFLLENLDGQPVTFKNEDVENKFIASLKGKVKGETGWSVLNEDLILQNPKGIEFHSFSEDEFQKDGHLVAYEKLKFLVDDDGDGIIVLPTDEVDKIFKSLASEYTSEELARVNREEFARVHEKVIIYNRRLLPGESNDEDYSEDENWYNYVENVFSWNIEKYFQ